MKAKKAHQNLYRLLGNDNNNNLSETIALPLYNQPMDLPIIRKNNEQHQQFRSKLIDRINRYKKLVTKEQQIQAEKYDQQMLEWLKKVEKIESNPVKKQRDLKIRESFEKHFPEIRKQREDRERVQRNSNQQHRIRSDAELEEIMDGLQHQELEDKKMRSYIVIPPIMYTRIQLKNLIRFDNQNGYLQDPMSLYKEIRNINIWTEGEKEIFREKYLLNPKKFGIIAQYLERKSIADCINYYYLSKKHENYKQLLRKHVKKRTRAMIKAQQQQQHHQNLVNQRGSPHLINQNNNQSQHSISGLDGTIGSSSTTASTTTSLSTSSTTTLSSSASAALLNRQYPNSSTSVILPYSIAITTNIATITFSLTSTSMANSSGDITTTTTTTTNSNGKISTISTTTTPNTNNNVHQTNNQGDSSSSSTVINRCDNSDNSDLLANGSTTTTLTTTECSTNSTICDNSGNSSSSSSIGCCLCCGDHLVSTNPQKSRPITQNNYQSYGLQLSTLLMNSTTINQKTSNGNQILGRVCFGCHLKKQQQQQSTNSNLREKRYCPMPLCISTSSSSSNANNSTTNTSTNNTPKRKKLHLKQLPQQWLDMLDDNELKQQISKELQIPLDIKIGCARCVMRLNRRLSNRTINLDQKLIDNNQQQQLTNTSSSITNIDSSSMVKEDFRKVWSSPDDQEKLRTMIRTYGKNWATISSNGSFEQQKTPQDCYKAFVLFKNEFQLVSALKEFYQSIGRPWNSAIDSGEDTDGDNGGGGGISGDDDTTASSLDDNQQNNNESDTASASSSSGGGGGGSGKPTSSGDNHQETQNSLTKSNQNLQDCKPLSLSQSSLKSDYDSSATMSADESSNNMNETNNNTATGLDRSSGSFSFPNSGSRSGSSTQQQHSNNVKIETKVMDDLKQSNQSSSYSTSSSSSFNRDKLVGFDAPQVPMFLINPNAPSIQISSSSNTSSSVPSTTAGSNRTPTPHSTSKSSSINDVNNLTSTTSTNNNNNDNNNNNSGGTCVRDLIWKAIEKSLSTETGAATAGISSSQPSSYNTTHTLSSESTNTTAAAVKIEPCSTVVQQSSSSSNNNSTPLCLKREISTPNSNQSLSRQPTPDLSKMDILASTALQQQQQQQRSGGMNLMMMKPEGLAAGINFSYGSNSTTTTTVEDEVQDLSNKSSKRSYDQTILQQQRNSPKDFHHHHPINNKIMKMDSIGGNSGGGNQSSRSSPFSHHSSSSSLMDNSAATQNILRPPYAHSSNLLMNNNNNNNNHPASRIPNMIDAFMTSNSGGVHHITDPMKMNRSSTGGGGGQSSNIYGQVPSLKINSKSSQQPPSSSTFALSPKAETAVRDKLTSGSITQGTPVVLQPGQLGQQHPQAASPHHYHHQQQQQQAVAAMAAALNVSVSGSGSKFSQSHSHPANILPPPPSSSLTPQSHHHQTTNITGSFHPSIHHHPIHYNELYRHMNNPDLAKGSITQGTPLIMPAIGPGNNNNNNIPIPGGGGGHIPPGTNLSSLIPTTQSHYHHPHHHQLLQQINPPPPSSSNRKNNDSSPLDFAVVHGGGSGNKRSNNKSNNQSSQQSTANVSIPNYDFIDRMKTNYESTISQHQLPIYHRPFSPNYPSSGSLSLSSKSSSAANNNNVQNIKSDSAAAAGGGGNINQILIDFNTSKQMQPRRSSASSSEKESDRIQQQDSSGRLIQHQPPPPPPSAPPLPLPSHQIISDKSHSRPTSSFQISAAAHQSSPYLHQDRIITDGKNATILDQQQQAFLHWNPIAFLVCL